MKKSKTPSSLLTVVFAMLSLVTLDTARASGGGGGFASASGGNGSGGGGAQSSGGGHGASGSSASMGRASAGATSFAHGTSASHPGFLRSNATIPSAAPRYLPGGITPNASGTLSSRPRPATAMTASRPVIATQQYSAAPQTLVSLRRKANAWTDNANSVNPRADRTLFASRANLSAAAYRDYLANGNYNGQITPDVLAGTYLYPGVYGSTLNNFYNGQAPRGAASGGQRVRSYAREDRWYGPNAPRHRYWPNGYYPYLGGYGYPFFGSYAGYGDGVLGTYDGDGNPNTAAVVPYAPDQSVATMDNEQPTTAEAQAEQPEPQANAPRGTLGNGPDSLVEAVQAELARRGYFSGKVDAIYGPETKEALRRFQADQKLTTTGRVNEATLHALQLD